MRGIISRSSLALSTLVSLALLGASCGPDSADTLGPKGVAPRALIELHENWQFRQAGSDEWRPARVPGCVHTDLLDNNVIAEPFYRANEEELQWIGKKGWVYESEFQVDRALLGREHVELRFLGLDTYAEVSLNGEPLLSADNMHKEWRVDTKQALRAGQNTLRVSFRSIFDATLPSWQQAPFELQSYPNNDQANMYLAVYSRKAGFHYGWDWGPRFITAGIWRPVLLEAWDDLRISDLQIFQEDVTEARAEIRAEVQIESARRTSATIRIADGETVYGTQVIGLEPGSNRASLEFQIERPRLWWTRDLGPQPLYELTSSLEQAGVEVDRRSVKVGLRSLRVVRENDAYGQSFYVELNGVPVFAKGANYIPQDSFQSRVTRDRTERLIRAAADAHMNMLRVWGGGIFEDDWFYETCDRYGILVWQDLMFACGMYPADEAYLASVRDEVRQNVRRLRNHPSLALLCGNNENESGWYNGWRGGFSAEVQATYEQNLNRLFYEVIPEAIAEIDPGIYYHPTSPSDGFNKPSGLDTQESAVTSGAAEGVLDLETVQYYRRGDVHYWDVWHGGKSFQSFNTNIGRFMSEYGFQSFPELASVKKFTLPEDRDLHSPVMLAHQRSMASNRKDREYGNRLIRKYMKQHFQTPKDFPSYLYVSQLLQAEGMKVAIEAHRRHRPLCMGSLYWQLNDCWPAASWSGIDYYGRWKALHYYARRANSPLLVAPYRKMYSVQGEKRAFIEIFVSSDLLEEKSARLEIRLLDFAGKVLWRESADLLVSPSSSKAYLVIDESAMLAAHDKREVVLSARLLSGGQVIGASNLYLTPMRDLALPVPVISRKLEKTDGGHAITLRSDRLAKSVFLTTEKAEGFFSDNFFDLLPGEAVTVRFESDAPVSDLEGDLGIVSLVDSFVPQERSDP